MFNRLALLALFMTTACATDADTDFSDPPQVAPLTTDETAQLPDDAEPIHAAELEAAVAAQVDVGPGSVFDDAETVPAIDVADPDGDPVAVNTIAFAPILKFGLHPRASDGLRAAGVDASRIVQTIGNAPASAGTHAQDGTFAGHPYSAATDISVRNLTQTQIANLLERLAQQGFAAWYRHTGHDGWNGVDHIHAVYANCAMKSSLRSQIHSWLAGRNGLVSNTIYTFHHFSVAAKAAVTSKFAMSHSGTSNGGGGVGGRVSTSGAALTIRASASPNGAAIGSLANGTYFGISCQKHGATVTGHFGSSDLWDRVDGGYVTDTYVSTGSDGQVAPTCH